MKLRWLMAGAAAATLTVAQVAGIGVQPLRADVDLGSKVENMLRAESNMLFGVSKPLEEGFDGNMGRAAGQTASDLVVVAPGLEASILTRNLANSGDMIAFWPNAESPQWLVACIEGGRTTLGNGKLNPGVQRISIDGSTVETILRGTTSCDGIRTTPWGTIVATEEASDGGVYEILDPLAATDYKITDRAAGTVTDAAGNPQSLIAKRTVLPTIAWEGFAVLPSGVVIAGDELRPGTPADADGGAMFKFVPTTLRTSDTPIALLSQSPLVSGSVWAMRVSCTTGTQYGQGCEVGNAGWVTVPAATARASADAAGATGYYRPEDLHADPTFAGPGVRFCWTNTGNEDVKNYAEVMCAIDSVPNSASSTLTVAVSRWLEGDEDFNSFDNLDFQPKTGNLYVIEDHPNGDIFACLPDGGDRNRQTDGCVRILSVMDPSAEPTGFIFDASGTTAYVIVQHSDDPGFALVDGYRTDDLVKITGFRVK